MLRAAGPAQRFPAALRAAAPELTILMPCLDEAATVARCVTKACAFLERAGIEGEVVVADNGSVDGSPQLAEAAGARVIQVAERGYGAALRSGIAAARGRYVIMGDADDSYDFSRLDGFIERLRAGDRLVMGNRFRGGILPGAMPPLHRYLGNPVLSFVGRLFFRTRVGDFHCGLRGFDREAVRGLALGSSGMEFASELVLRAALAGWRIAEVPTTLSPDGRGRPPHLRSWRDGWRHLRLLLLFSPRWLFLYPGLVLLGAGLSLTTAIYFAPLQVLGAGLDIHSMLYAAAAALLGLQLCLFSLFARVSAQSAGLLPRQPAVERLLRVLTLERGLLGGLALAFAGFTWSAAAFWAWRETGFGALDPRVVMRDTIPASALMVAGMELMLASFLLSVLRMKDGR
jgi:glycosyltransferase involved in cell wall biosynthesis